MQVRMEMWAASGPWHPGIPMALPTGQPMSDGPCVLRADWDKLEPVQRKTKAQVGMGDRRSARAWGISIDSCPSIEWTALGAGTGPLLSCPSIG